MTEMLDVVDENGMPTGEIVDRERAHRDGIRHRTSHVWLARVKAGGDLKIENIELLLQRRSMDKDSNPGCLDISSAGHIPAGCTYVESALRELKEELGLDIEADALCFCGKRRKSYKKSFHGREFSDNQVSNVYVIFCDIKASDIVFQKSEISEVLWMPFDDVYKMAEQDEHSDNPQSCLALEEMQLLRNYIRDHADWLNVNKGISYNNGQTQKVKPVKLTTLCYIEQNGKYLMLYRNKKKDDQSKGKWLGVGGKLESGESPEDCLIREVYEETGLRLTEYKFRGIITFVSDIWENELMFLYTADTFDGKLKDDCDEGCLKWIPKEDVRELNVWEGDRIFLDELLKDNNDIHIRLVYEDDKLVEFIKY